MGVPDASSGGRAAWSCWAACLKDVTIMTRTAGINAHKADLRITVMDEAGEEVDHFHVPSEPAGFTELSDRLAAGDHVGIEASTVCYRVVEHLHREGFAVQVGHPKKLASLLDHDFKNDDRDS